MAEIEQNGQAVGGLPEPSPVEAKIKSQNARRVSRRAQAALLAEDIARVSGENLDRRGDTRQVGGRFEKLQKVPKRKTPERQGLNLSDLAALLQALSFGGSNQVIGSNSFISSFGPGIIGVNNAGS